jgi:hypothetical protein
MNLRRDVAVDPDSYSIVHLDEPHREAGDVRWPVSFHDHRVDLGPRGVRRVPQRQLEEERCPHGDGSVGGDKALVLSQ